MNRNHLRGFTLLETFIALAIGVFMFAGVISAYSAMRSTSSETLAIGDIQETARMAMNLLKRDIEKAGFWGADLDFNLEDSLTTNPVAFASDCIGDGPTDNNRSFPVLASDYPFRYLWLKTATQTNEMGCIQDSKAGSDILQLKRAVGARVASTADFRVNRYYLISSDVESGLVAGNAAVFPDIENSQNWMYQHIVYYVSTAAGGTALRRKRLIIGGDGQPSIDTSSLIDGIERIHFQLGVDTTGDQQVDVYLAPAQVTQAIWDQSANARIMAVKIFVLARASQPDKRYTNNNRYQLGNVVVNGGGDNYRRILLTSTVRVENAATTNWYEGGR